MKKWFVLLVCTALLACLAVTCAAADGGSRVYGYNENGEYTILFYDENGKRFTDGWITIDGYTYYLEGGRTFTGWKTIGDDKYYFYRYGNAAIGPTAIQRESSEDYDHYYFDKNGRMQTGWVQDGAWYYLASSGRMQTGWQEIDGSWYYLKSDGKMASGWLQLGSTWYYLAGGKMVTGWQEIDGQWEMFSDSGAWLYTWQGN